jgi:hypothetical protein
VRTINVKPDYGENYVSDFKVHFSVVGDRVPLESRDIRISVYRQENELSTKFPSKVVNLGGQLEIARVILSKRQLDSAKTLKVPMQIRIELPMDIAVPLFKKAEVTLGIVKMASHSLQLCRNTLNSVWKLKPYSESLYSFNTRAGNTLSLEQLFASKYSIRYFCCFLVNWHSILQF